MGWKTRFVSKAVKDWKCLEKMDVSKSHSNRIFWAQWRLPSNSTPNSRPKGTFYFLRGPPTFVWSLWKSKRKPLKWHAFWLSFFFFFLSFFLLLFSFFSFFLFSYFPIFFHSFFFLPITILEINQNNNIKFLFFLSVFLSVFYKFLMQ